MLGRRDVLFRTPCARVLGAMSDVRSGLKGRRDGSFSAQQFSKASGKLWVSPQPETGCRLQPGKPSSSRCCLLGETRFCLFPLPHLPGYDRSPEISDSNVSKECFGCPTGEKNLARVRELRVCLKGELPPHPGRAIASEVTVALRGDFRRSETAER